MMSDLQKEQMHQSIFEINNKKTRWFKCRVCGEQFAYRRLLEAHKKLSVCFKDVQK